MNKPKAGKQSLSVAQFRDAKKLPIGDGFVLLMLNEGEEAQVRPGDEAPTLVSKAAVALRSPGIARTSVFRNAAAHQKRVFAYSAHPADSSMLIREAEDGTQEVGKFGADGRFRISRKAM
ncbi:hypothetical protein [Pelomonas sp. SE-A7]|uniref:hypothetical protein n=1 Tax=Pelomonas sp. SE-A7 TaxID=3054953 RepID=UPI00259CF58D|nr:hypothetical protein [Pelomonas sp. SE-A7]MDM4768265.1 hypothetical protein [Pelomonas sp. SE-A7]